MASGLQSSSFANSGHHDHLSLSRYDTKIGNAFARDGNSRKVESSLSLSINETKNIALWKRRRRNERQRECRSIAWSIDKPCEPCERKKILVERGSIVSNIGDVLFSLFFFLFLSYLKVERDHTLAIAWKIRVLFALDEVACECLSKTRRNDEENERV